MSKVLIYSQEDLDLILELKKEENEELQQENQELKEAIEDYERIFDIWSKRTLINKFNKEYSKKVVKEEREKGHKIVSALPDVEYVYKKYYELQERIDKAIEYINENLILVSSLDGTKTFGLNSHTFDYKELLDILKEVSE